ncbi:MAG TPA: hypothetical protein VJZ04_11830 [Lachnospiraceae bacterium]|nr:hypothetical protein [Lachnospiraceae bacterium]
MGHKEAVFIPALDGKKIPILTLDNKWYQLLSQLDSNETIGKLEKQLNELIKRQGKLTTESKEIKKIKARLMDEIVGLMDSMEESKANDKTEKKLDENKRLINECNEKLDSYQDEMLDLPKEIDQMNYKLMLETMEKSYHCFQENKKDMEEISQWIKKIRVELKKKVIRKQEREKKNQEIYTYMHNIFGAEVIEIFDIEYNAGEMKNKK